MQGAYVGCQLEDHSKSQGSQTVRQMLQREACTLTIVENILSLLDKTTTILLQFRQTEFGSSGWISIFLHRWAPH
jgi:hypothetical protein